MCFWLNILPSSWDDLKNFRGNSLSRTILSSTLWTDYLVDWDVPVGKAVAPEHQNPGDSVPREFSVGEPLTFALSWPPVYPERGLPSRTPC